MLGWCNILVSLIVLGTNSAQVIIPNITVLASLDSYHKNFYCVVDDDHLNSAITWVTSTLTDNPVSEYIDTNNQFQCEMNPQEPCLKYWTKGGWQSKSSLQYRFGPVFDHRWEKFKIYQTESNYEQITDQLNYTNFEVHFCIRIEQDVNVYLCDGKDPRQSNCYWFVISGWKATSNVFRKCKSREIPTGKYSYPGEPCRNALDQKNDTISRVGINEWNHFTLKGSDHEYSVKKIGEPEPFLTYFDQSANLFRPNYLIINSREKSVGIWKFHSYSFVLTTEADETQLGPGIWPVDATLCLAFFALMCNTCKLNLKLKDQRERVMQTMQVHSQGVEWAEVTFLITNLDNQTEYKLFVAGESSESNPFWAIDDVRQCRREREIRVSTLNYNSVGIPDVSCYSLRFPTLKINIRNAAVIQKSDSTCPVESFGRNCLPCNEVLKDNYCEKHAVCEIGTDHKTKCTCSAGYRGEKCDTACSDHLYGFGCNDKCGRCSHNTCNHINGNCYPCTDDYTGETCKIPRRPILKYPPKINVSHTSISVQLTNQEYEGLLNPVAYKFQYKHNRQQWQNTQEYNFVDLSPKTVMKLRSDTEYVVRAVLRAYNDDFQYDFAKEETIRTTCAGITEEDLSIIPTNVSAEIFIKKSEEMCSLNKFEMTVGKRKIFLDFHVFITSLLPHKTYDVVIKSLLTNETVEISFSTLQGKPEKVRNLQIANTSSTMVTLTWERPEIINGDISYYKVSYKHRKYLGCSKTVNSQDSIGEMNVTDKIVTINDLIPYSNYIIQVRGITIMDGDVEYIEISTLQTDTPNSKEMPVLSLKPVSNSNYVQIILTQVKCEDRRGPLVFLIKLCCTNEWCPPHLCEVKNETSTLTETVSTFIDVVANSNYMFEMEVQRTNGSYLKEKLQRTFTTPPSAPNPVRNLTVYSKTKNSVFLRWMQPYPPTGEVEHYKISFVCSNCHFNHNWAQLFQPVTCKIWPEFICAVVQILDDFTGYYFKFDVTARNKIPKEYGPIRSAYTLLTVEIPDSPKNLTATWDDENNLTLTWLHPDYTNGPLTGFKIKAAENPIQNFKTDEKLLYSYVITNSPLSKKISVSVASQNEAGESRAIKVDTYSPPKTPKFREDPYLQEPGNYTLTIIIPAPSDLLNNSMLLLIVTDLGETSTPTVHIPKQIEEAADIDTNYFSWIAAEIMFADYAENQRKVIIGLNEVVYSHTLKLNILNRSLKMGSNYTVTFLLSNTYMNKTRSSVRKILCTTVGELDRESHLYLFSLLLIPLLCFAGVFLFRKHKIKISLPGRPITHFRHFASRSNPDVIPLAEAERPQTRIRPPIRPKPKTPTPVKLNANENAKFSRVVKLSDFEAYVKEAIETGELERQHAMFPRGQTRPWEHGTKPHNKSKNRYNNLAAYDHTRVELEIINGDATSDYINANYIEGYKVPRAYIATQGPKQSTVDDFWRMIWQEGVEYIVMLANVYENGKRKVEKYWPDINQFLDFDDIQVHYVSVEVFADYEYRIFNAICDGQEREIKQLHFMSWPDHGVPLYAQSLLPLLRKMLTIPHGKSPVVVHCSAGVGRTGTIILCDICLRMAAREGEVDVLYHQHKIREQRANMVDNIGQYKLVHLVLLQCLVAPETNLACDEEMSATVEKMLNGDTIDFQIKYLDDSAWQDRAMLTAMSDDNICPLYPKKNRFEDIIPDEMSRVFILPYPTTDETSSYINAVKVDGFQSPSKFIVTQHPLPDTLGDFWRLVHEKDISVIVSLNKVDVNDETSCEFWPTNILQHIQPVPYLKVSYLEIVNDTDYDIVSCHLIDTDDEDSDTRLLRILDVKSWDYSKYHPANPNQLLAAVEEVNRLGKTSTCILVTCHDGVRASGLFVALSFVIDKIKLEQECDVCLAVRTVRRSRKDFIRDKDQFRFLYRAAAEYVNGFEIYSNFASGKK